MKAMESFSTLLSFTGQDQFVFKMEPAPETFHCHPLTFWIVAAAPCWPSLCPPLPSYQDFLTTAARVTLLKFLILSFCVKPFTEDSHSHSMSPHPCWGLWTLPLAPCVLSDCIHSPLLPSRCLVSATLQLCPILQTPPPWGHSLHCTLCLQNTHVAGFFISSRSLLKSSQWGLPWPAYLIYVFCVFFNVII